MCASLSRRGFLGSAAFCAAGFPVSDLLADAGLPVVDIHQHTHYHGRSDQVLMGHQRAMGITRSILLPAGSDRVRKSTRGGKSNGLAAKVAGNDEAMRIAKENPGRFYFGANEVTDLEGARSVIEKYLKLGAVIIGEQKFDVEADSNESQELYRLAADYEVPILLHFQHRTYNRGFERFHKMLEKHTRTNFIGHAQTWWANIDKAHNPENGLYPKGPVEAGGLTDRYLSDYPNMFADMSAGSGLNSLLRDEAHTVEFLDRHQDKILYGSDCADSIGRGPGCQGARTLDAIRRLAKNGSIVRKILHDNAARIIRF
jgi:predicted TIM-barrel fold metal-dependent hydrolase